KVRSNTAAGIAAKRSDCNREKNQSVQFIIYYTREPANFKTAIMKKIIFMCCALLCFGFAAMAQTKTITGKVTNLLTGEAMQGVNILADKQKGGVVTDAEGNYSIKVTGKSSTLVFSYVGFSTQTVIIGDKTSIDVKLAPAPED